jgi:hypothetical protein
MLTAAIARYLADLDSAVYGTFDVAGASIHLEELPAEAGRCDRGRVQDRDP